MKIAIMTFYEPNAYGIVLQAAALRHYLISMGHEADVIRYLSDGRVAILPSGSVRSGFLAQARLILKNDRNPIVADTANAEGFDRFRNKYLSMTEECLTLSDLEGLNEQYDAFICGSGNVWSAAGFDPHMFLDFVKDPDRMIAYAPSFLYEGNEDDLTLKRIGELVERFKHLSVREETGRRLMNDYYGIHTEEVADPVLLLDPQQWQDLLGEDWEESHAAMEEPPADGMEEPAGGSARNEPGAAGAEPEPAEDDAEMEPEETGPETPESETADPETEDTETDDPGAVSGESTGEKPGMPFEDGEASPVGYLLSYFLSDRNAYRASAKNLAQRKHLQMKTIPFRESDLSQPGAIRECVDPAMLVNLVRQASYVCTDCYHVVLLAIIFHKELCCFNRYRKGERTGLNARIVHILDAVGMLGRLYDDNAPIEQYLERTDFIPVQYKLDALRLKSDGFLRKSLEQVQAYCHSCSRNVRHVREVYSLCCGCGACVDVCKAGALSLKHSRNGFWEAVVDENICRRCGRCTLVCPMRDGRSGNDLEEAWVLSYSDEDDAVLAASDGGGFSYRLAELLRKKGWAVAGCVFNEKSRRAEHVLILPEGVTLPEEETGNGNPAYDAGSGADNASPAEEGENLSDSLSEEEWRQAAREAQENMRDDPEVLLGKMQGVKLMQSVPGSLWKKLEQTSCPVIFFGTPCQCAAARKRLAGRENLVCVDMICSGVPTDLLLARYISAFRGRNSSAGECSVVFRGKNHKGKEVVRISDGVKVRETPIRRDAMARMLSTGACSGEFCYDCRWRDRTCADLRLGSASASCLERFETDISMRRVAEEKKPAALDKGTFGRKKDDVTVIMCMNGTGKNLLDMLMVEGYWEGLHRQDAGRYLKAVRRKNNPKPVYYAELMDTLADERVSIRKLVNEFAKPIEKRSKAIERLQMFTHAGRAAVSTGERAGKKEKV